jgi:hypothetical protein
MSRILAFGLVPLFTAPVIAAFFPSWSDSPVPQWSTEDARQFLSDSPWVKKVQLDKIRNLSVFERRDGGDWDAGIPSGIGIARAGLFADWREIEAIEHEYAVANLGTVAVRWESALPVRAAEAKIGETDVPAWTRDFYAIAVHDTRRPDWRNLSSQLKRVAYLHRGHKKDIRPVRVLILPRPDKLATFVYLFPRSVEFASTDQSIEFVAQIGRLFVAVNFFPSDMRLQGQLQL